MRSSHSHETVMILERATKPNGEVENRKYTIGNLLGIGGFAKVYEVTDIATNKKLAGKVIPKASLQSAEQKQKLMAEINAHRILKHPNIVRLETFFEDKDNIYILLELCSPQTLNDYLQKKQRLTEPEVRKFLSQLIDALKYLHSQRIIHRDIKLKNLFLTDDMDIKLGDFGLSCKLSFYGERRYTVCGTPNYIAPEVLTKSGHSYEVDIWALGVVFYYLLTGVAPFENPDNKIIYKKIKEINYAFPADIPISAEAKNLISKMLQLNPEKRPSLDEILQHPFFAYSRHSPREIKKPLFDVPSNRTSIKPILKREPSPNRRLYVDTKPNLLAIEDHKTMPPKLTSPVKSASVPMPSSTSKKNAEFANKMALAGNAENVIKVTEVKSRHSVGPVRQKAVEQEKLYLDLPVPVQNRRLSADTTKGGENEVYVTKWLDYASKYGIGYALSDDSIGVVFNDQSKIACQNLSNKEFMYIEDSGVDGTEKIFTYSFDRYPDALGKKVALYNYFKDYLDHNKNGVSVVTTVGNSSSATKKHLPGWCMYVSKWIKTKQAIFFKLNSKVMQIVFKDGAVITLKPASGNVEYIDREGDRSYYGLNEALAAENKEIAQRMGYVQDTLKEMWKHREEK